MAVTIQRAAFSKKSPHLYSQPPRWEARSVPFQSVGLVRACTIAGRSEPRTLDSDIDHAITTNWAVLRFYDSNHHDHVVCGVMCNANDRPLRPQTPYESFATLTPTDDPTSLAHVMMVSPSGLGLLPMSEHPAVGLAMLDLNRTTRTVQFASFGRGQVLQATPGSHFSALALDSSGFGMRRGPSTEPCFGSGVATAGECYGLAMLSSEDCLAGQVWNPHRLQQPANIDPLLDGVIAGLQHSWSSYYAAYVDAVMPVAQHRMSTNAGWMDRHGNIFATQNTNDRQATGRIRPGSPSLAGALERLQAQKIRTDAGLLSGHDISVDGAVHMHLHTGTPAATPRSIHPAEAGVLFFVPE